MVVRELFAKLGLDVDETAFKTADAAMEGLKGGLTAVVAAGAAVGVAIAAAIGHTVHFGGELTDISKKAGTTAEAFQEYSFAAKQSGVDSGELAQSLVLLSKQAVAAAHGGEEQAKAFATAGVAIRKHDGTLKNSTELMDELSDKFAAMPDGIEKTALATQLFGRSGANMLAFLSQGSTKIAELRKEMRDMGAVMSDDAVAAADELGDRMDVLQGGIAGLLRNAIAPLLPEITELVDHVIKWIKANKDIIRQNITGFVKGVFQAVKIAWKAFEVLAKVVGFLVDNFWLLVSVLAAALLPTMLALASSLISTIAWYAALGVAAVLSGEAALGAWLAAAAPIIAMAALAGLIYLIFNDIWVALNGGKSVIGELEARFGAFIDEWTASPGEGGIVGAILWFVKLFTYIFRTFIPELLTDFWGTLGDGWGAIFSSWGTAIKGFFVGIFDWVMANIKEVALGAAKAIAGAIPGLGGALQLGASAVDAVGGLFGGGASPESTVQTSVTNGPANTPVQVKAPSFKADFQINQQPGQNPTDVATEVDKKMEQFFQNKMSEAYSPAGG